MTSTTPGQEIRAVREAAGISQEELAKRLGCTQTDVSRVELGGVLPRAGRLREFAVALNATWQIGETWTLVPNS